MIFTLSLSLLSVLHLSLDFRSKYSLYFAYASSSPQLSLSPSSPVSNEWGSSFRWTEVGLERSGGGRKGWTGTTENWPEEIHSDGWPKNGTRRAREKEERRTDDGELSFHFPFVWLLDDEDHYSLKEYPTPPSSLSFCHVLSIFVHSLSVIFLCLLCSSFSFSWHIPHSWINVNKIGVMKYKIIYHYSL